MEVHDHPNFPHLRVCREHGLPYDTVPLPGGHWQRCHRCPDGTENRWEDSDLSEWIHICECCVIDVTRSGSRWSSFYCDECRQRILALRRSDRPLAIPLGRHSMMNAIALEGARAFEPRAVETFTDALDGMFNSIAAVSEWRKRRISLLLEGFDEDPLLTEVMARGATRWTKQEAFEALCHWWVTPDAAIDWRTTIDPDTS